MKEEKSIETCVYQTGGTLFANSTNTNGNNQTGGCLFGDNKTGNNQTGVN